jgi:hypothetical protein
MPRDFEIPKNFKLILKPFPEEIELRTTIDELITRRDSQEPVVIMQQSQADRVRLYEELAPQYGLMVDIVGQPGETVVDHLRNLEWPVSDGNLGVRITIPRGVAQLLFTMKLKKE